MKIGFMHKQATAILSEHTSKGCLVIFKAEMEKYPHQEIETNRRKIWEEQDAPQQWVA